MVSMLMSSPPQEFAIFLKQNDLNLRQRRWLELLKYYEMSVLYHPDKANLVDSTKGGVTVHNDSELYFVSDIKAKQSLDPILIELNKVFWKSFPKGLGTRIKLNATFNPKTDERCTSPIGWFEVGKVALIGPELVHEAMEKMIGSIRKSPMKGVMRFGKKGKLSPCYVGLYQVLRRIGNVAYEPDLPNDLASVHPVFHVSLLKKCVGDPTSIVPLGSLGISDSLSYEEVSVEILDRQVRKLRNKEVSSVKVFRGIS
ncbi:hypothetical protein MTR67_026891 [Solanum verrucosum]|uniref:Tf2-1-like SH3-like domain-containing protein n=1 Tax=Solanum verrucosum TaxID=315347 RepID=A0AAF0R852_SOLVR|nr:hypothetical protein MTR67_026891 [Solanum verrucosum]